jgi:hypothetical protein
MVSSVVITIPATKAQDIRKVPCNDLVYVRSKEMKNYLDFTGSSFKPIIKVTITYATIDGNNIGGEVVYETLWYCGADPIGCRRYRDFDLKTLDKLYIFATLSSSQEIAACSNAFVRLLLDASLNRNAITAVEVPSEFFSEFIDKLEVENFYSLTKLQVRPAIYLSLPLRDEKGDKNTLVHSNQ